MVVVNFTSSPAVAITARQFLKSAVSVGGVEEKLREEGGTFSIGLRRIIS
jgi:hypothetical protein